MDLFEPGSGAQVHDLNGGVLASGLFWTLPLDDDALHVSNDGRLAMLDVKDLQVIENYRLFGPNSTPATLSYRIEWEATGPFVDRGKDATVAPTDPAAFLARFAVAWSTAAFEVSEFASASDRTRASAQTEASPRWAASATASFCSEPRSQPRRNERCGPPPVRTTRLSCCS